MHELIVIIIFCVSETKTWQDGSGRTVLHWLAGGEASLGKNVVDPNKREKQIKCFELLMQQENVDQCWTKQERTPLETAVQWSNFVIVEYILENLMDRFKIDLTKKIDWGSSNKQLYTLVQLATMNHAVEILDALIKCIVKKCNNLAQSGDEKEKYEKSFSEKFGQDLNHTLLTKCLESGSFSTINYDENITTSDLDNAKDDICCKCIELLIDSKMVDVNAEATTSLSPLLYAVYFDYYKCIERFLNCDNINVKHFLLVRKENFSENATTDAELYFQKNAFTIACQRHDSKSMNIFLKSKKMDDLVGESNYLKDLLEDESEIKSITKDNERKIAYCTKLLLQWDARMQEIGKKSGLNVLQTFHDISSILSEYPMVMAAYLTHKSVQDEAKKQDYQVSNQSSTT